MTRQLTPQLCSIRNHPSCSRARKRRATIPERSQSGVSGVRSCLSGPRACRSGDFCSRPGGQSTKDERAPEVAGGLLSLLKTSPASASGFGRASWCPTGRILTTPVDRGPCRREQERRRTWAPIYVVSECRRQDGNCEAASAVAQHRPTTVALPEWVERASQRVGETSSALSVSLDQCGPKTAPSVHSAITFATGNSMLPVPPPTSTRILASSMFPSVIPAAAHASKCSVMDIVPHWRADCRTLQN
jgi:hypothetical protein